jgi:hypothetical protein
MMTTTARRKLSTRNAPRDDPEQSKAFIAKARELGADGNDSDADKLMRRLAKMPPQPKQKK